MERQRRKRDTRVDEYRERHKETLRQIDTHTERNNVTERA